MKIRLNLKIFVFIVLFILTRQIEIYGILMLFAIFHELGHMMVGILLGFKPNTLEIMPLGLSVGFEGKVENYNKKIKKGTVLVLKKIIIALAGPLTNLIFIIIFSVFNISFFCIENQLVIYSNILIGIFNLIPIYPLDGGRIIKGILHIFLGKRVALEYINKISYISVIVLTFITSIAILYLKNIAILLILAYLWYLVIIEHRRYNMKKQIYNKLEKIKESKLSIVS